jgi:hypothetical protein
MRGVLTLCVLLLHSLPACTAFVNRPSAIQQHTQTLRGGARSERITHKQKTQQQLDIESSDSLFSSESDTDIKSVVKKPRSKRKKASRKHSKPQPTYTEFSDSEPDEEEVGVEIKRVPASSFDDDWFDNEQTLVRASSSTDVNDDNDTAAAAHADAHASSEILLTGTAVEVTVTVGADSDKAGASSEADSTDASIHAVKGSDSDATIDVDTSSVAADELQEQAAADSEASVDASSEEVEQSAAALEAVTDATAANADTVRNSASDTDTAVRAAADALDSDDADFDEAIADSAAELFDSLTLATKTFKGDLLDLDLDLSDLDLSNLDMADLDDIDEASSAELVELADADSSTINVSHTHTQTAVDSALGESSEAAVAVIDNGVTEDVAGDVAGESSSAEVVADESDKAILPQELHDTTEDVCIDNNNDDVVTAAVSEDSDSDASSSADEQSDAEQLAVDDNQQSHAATAVATAAATVADKAESALQFDSSNSSEAEQSDAEVVDAAAVGSSSGGSSSSSSEAEQSEAELIDVAAVGSGSSSSDAEQSNAAEPSAAALVAESGNASSSEAEKSEAELVEVVAVESSSSDSSSEAEQSDVEAEVETVAVTGSSSDSSSSEAEESDADQFETAVGTGSSSSRRSSSSEENSESSSEAETDVAAVSEEQPAESLEGVSDASDYETTSISIDDFAEADDVVQSEEQQQQQQLQTIDEWLDEELTAPVLPEPKRVPLSDVENCSDWTGYDDDDSDFITTSSSSSGGKAAATKGKQDTADADAAVDGAQLLDQKLASIMSSQFGQTLKQLLAVVVAHGYAQIVRSYSRDKQTVNLYRLSGGLTAACIVLDTLIARAIRSTPHSNDDADAMFDVTATSPLGTLLGKKPRLQSVTADAHDLMVLRTTRVWSIAYLLVGCVLSAVCSDLEPLFIAAYTAFRRYIQEPLYAQYVKPGEKLQFVRPYVQPNRLNNVLGAPYTAQIVVSDDADTAEVDSTSSSSRGSSRRHQQQQLDIDSDASYEQEDSE